MKLISLALAVAQYDAAVWKVEEKGSEPQDDATLRKQNGSQGATCNLPTLLQSIAARNDPKLTRENYWCQIQIRA